MKFTCESELITVLSIIQIGLSFLLFAALSSIVSSPIVTSTLVSSTRKPDDLVASPDHCSPGALKLLGFLVSIL